MHTTCSDGSNSYEEMIQRALDLRFDFIALTDHLALDQGCEEIAKCQAETRLLCIPGAEQSRGFNHYLVIGISSRIENYLTWDTVVDEVHQRGGWMIAAHPYSAGFRYSEDDLYHSRFDAMECARGTPEDNQRQLALSEKYNLPCVYSSDAHKKESMGQMYTVCTATINSLADLKAAVIGKKCRRN